MKASLYRMRDFDIVGLSYYPQWHGSIANLTETLEMVAWEFEKPVLIAETAYPYTSTRFGSDVIDVSKGVLAAYPATTSGQAAYVKKLTSIMKKLYANNGVGIWWWEGLATHVVRNNQVIWDSGMTNSTLVDGTGKALPALAALK
jgi:arabinogalactan endo-1,4-beta-galactosidase